MTYTTYKPMHHYTTLIYPFWLRKYYDNMYDKNGSHFRVIKYDTS